MYVCVFCFLFFYAKQYTKFKGLASTENTIQCQACVANILVPICQNSNDQKMLCKAGAIPLLARLITTRYTILQIPALKCLAAMCFTNKYVSDIVCNTK